MGWNQHYLWRQRRLLWLFSCETKMNALFIGEFSSAHRAEKMRTTNKRDKIQPT